MTRSSSVTLLGTLFANVMCLLGLSPLVAQEAFGKDVDSRPNVILIMTDDQGYGDMSCHGNPYIKTPNLDRLHDEAIRFSDFHVDPTCSPTRAALMTGRYSSRTGVWLTYAGRHHLRRDETTMADVFSSNGYRTAIFGKWHLGDNYPFRPHDRGFDESLIHGGGVIGEAPDTWGNDYYDDTYLRNGEPERVTGYCTDVWFDEAIRFAERNRGRPFFIYLPTNAPHGPFHVPLEYVQPYLGRQEIPESRAWFYGMIACIDQNIGRLRTRLEALDLAENTLLVFLTDNGTSGGTTLKIDGKYHSHGYEAGGYNAGMRGQKGCAYEGGHRAACFLHWPNGGLISPHDVGEMTAHIDLLPTLIGLCRLKAPAGVDFDGRSLAPLLQGQGQTWPERTLFVHHQGRFGQPVHEGLPIKYKDFAVMTDRWRLVGKELYDHSADPGQRTNVANQHTQVVTKLTQAYEDWWTDISERFEEYCPFVVDPEQQETTLLTCQSWHGDAIPYNQHHVRHGMQGNGYWVIDVAQSDEFLIELRRWPRELDVPMNALVPPETPDPKRHHAGYRLLQLPSRELTVVRARLQVGDFDQSVTVEQDARARRFTVPLPKGQHRLQTWFTNEQGDSRGAYYVYIERSRKN